MPSRRKTFTQSCALTIEAGVQLSFSHICNYAGYKDGEEPLPILPTVRRLSPIAGDNSAHIQTFLDEEEEQPLNQQGWRGALLLKEISLDFLAPL